MWPSHNVSTLTLHVEIYNLAKTMFSFHFIYINVGIAVTFHFFFQIQCCKIISTHTPVGDGKSWTKLIHIVIINSSENHGPFTIYQVIGLSFLHNYWTKIVERQSLWSYALCRDKNNFVSHNFMVVLQSTKVWEASSKNIILISKGFKHKTKVNFLNFSFYFNNLIHTKI